MIKEIEVGGVKHSITLADDMIGSGLTRTGSGKVCLNLPEMPLGDYFSTGLVIESGKLCINKYTLISSIAGTGLAVDDHGTLLIDVAKLAGTGLAPVDGKLMISGRELSTNAGLISGIASGLLAGPDFSYSLASGIAGILASTGLRVEGRHLSFDFDLVGSGLYTDFRSSINVAVGNGVTIDESLSYKPVCVKIAKRSAGLRLLFNEKGELDVTQD